MSNYLDYQFRTYLQQAVILVGIFWILYWPTSLIGQSNSLADIPFAMSDNPLPDPFTGGTLSPQYNQIDLDRDGFQDIVIYDRRGQIMTPYVYNPASESYDYRPEYREIFPEINSVLMIRDYNFDGVPDIYTMDIFSNSNSMVVYKGSINGDSYQWEIVSHAFEPIPYIYYEQNGQFNPVFNLFIDKPEILDVDGDGDLDILTFNSGGSKVDFYQNMTIEQGRDYDDHYYVIGDDCFGKFIESGTSSAIFLSADAVECYSLFDGENPVEQRHAGSTITAFDEDGDGDMDLLIGDLLSTNLVFLHNGGTAQSAWMDSLDEEFPSYDVPIDYPVWLGAYFMDVDHNGTIDMIAAPNDQSNADNINNAWLYLNSSDTEYDLTFTQSDFLKEHTVDLGEYSSPKFVDVDMDGLIDIVCGTRGDFNNNANDQARLLYFRNVGTASSPSYALEDNDFASMNQYTDLSLEFHPGFGDLDGDNDIDMLVGENNGYLYYFENIAGPDNKIEFANPIWQYMDIRPGTTSKPAIYDLDGDGLSDIVLGERNKNTNPVTEEVGSINMYRNIGSVGAPLFNRDILADGNWPNVGNVVGEAPGAGNASSSPVFYETDEGTLLIVGTRIGDIQMYGGDLIQYTSSYDSLDLRVGEIYEGRNSVVDVADIDDDGFLEMVVGNERGGLALYNTTVSAATGEIFSSTSDTSEMYEVSIYPNPSTDRITIESSKHIERVVLYNQLGQMMKSQLIGDSIGQLQLSSYPPGLYRIAIYLETGELLIESVARQ